MERENSSFEIDQEQDKTVGLKMKKRPGDADPKGKFLSAPNINRSNSKKNGSSPIVKMLKNQPAEDNKNKSYRDGLFDIFAEYWCSMIPLNLRSLIDELERSVIIIILNKVNGNQRIAAEALGMRPQTFHEKLKKYGIYLKKTPLING